MEKRGLVQPVYRIILYPGVNMARKNGVKFGGERKGFLRENPKKVPSKRIHAALAGILNGNSFQFT
jgi:hypothetical protein